MNGNERLSTDCTNTKEIDDLLSGAKYRLDGIDIEIELKGTIVYKYIKCGKKNCICTKGFLHGPYPHLQWWDKGKIKTKYLNKNNVSKYKEELEKNNRKREIEKEIKNLQEQKKILNKNIE